MDGKGHREARLQGVAFALILFASTGLYFTAGQAATPGTCVLLGAEAVAMLLALWIS